jgi:hypothetical protein
MEFDFKHEVGDSAITFEIVFGEKHGLKIFCPSGEDITIYVEKSHPSLYDKIVDASIECERAWLQENPRSWVDDAWKGYD